MNSGTVTVRRDEEATLRRRIRLLKKQEEEIRKERHQLEAQLRELILQRYMDMGKKLGLEE